MILATVESIGQESEKGGREEDAVKARLNTFRRFQMRLGPKHEPISPLFREAKGYFNETKHRMEKFFEEASKATLMGPTKHPLVYTAGTPFRSPCVTETGDGADIVRCEVSELNGRFQSIRRGIANRRVKRSDQNFRFFKEMIKNKDYEYFKGGAS